jgi:hypothetical protein
MRVEPAAEARIRELGHANLDWDLLVETAKQHRVLPLVWRTLSRLVSDELPKPVCIRLQEASHANARRNLGLTRELFNVMDLLQLNAIPCIPYKGPVFAHLIYQDIGLRQFFDLDVLIPSGDVLKARALLVATGYRPETPSSDAALSASLSTEKDITLLKDDQAVNLEIHWGITASTDPIHVDPRMVWEDLREHVIAGRCVQTHSYEDLLLFHCIHGAKHRWARLIWLCDIAEIVHGVPNVNWTLVLEKASQVGATRVVLMALTLAHDLLEARIPESVLSRARSDARLAALCDQVKRWLFGDTPGRLELAECEQYMMGLTERTSDKLRLAFGQAKHYLTLTARDTDPSPGGSFRGLLYVMRPVRLIRLYGLEPFKRYFRGVFQS